MISPFAPQKLKALVQISDGGHLYFIHVSIFSTWTDYQVTKSTLSIFKMANPPNRGSKLWARTLSRYK